MTTKFPAQIDNSSTLPLITDNVSLVKADTVNILRNAIIAIEQELGVKPSGTYGTVRGRLDALDGIIADLELGNSDGYVDGYIIITTASAAGGVLSGTYPNPGFSSFTSSTLATAVSDETGSGFLVFGTAPTISLPLIDAIKLGGGTPSSTGLIRLPYSASARAILTELNAAGDGYISIIKSQNSEASFGEYSAVRAGWLYGSLAGLWGYDAIAAYAGHAGSVSDLVWRSDTNNSGRFGLARPLSGYADVLQPFRWASGSITKSDATDLTLTAAQYELPYLIFGGTPGGNFNVIGPNTTGAYFTIINNTANTLTIKKSGGTGVAIGPGESRPVWHNGTDYAYSQSVTTIVPIASGVSGLGSNVATFLATPSSANLAAAVTDETGTGNLVLSTGATLSQPTVSDGYFYITDSDASHRYTIAAANLAADRTITLPLLAGNDTLVTEAFSQTLTNKTISGASNTITNVPISTGVSGLGSNVATFLATASSANLFSALTTKTGNTSSIVFADTPTLTTPKIADSSGGQVYAFAVSDLAADRTVTLPLLASADTFVFEAHTQTLTNKTLTSPDISSPTISGTPVITATSISATGNARARSYSDIANVQTTDATVTSLYTWTILDEAATKVVAEVCGCRSTGAETAAYTRQARIKRDGGTVTFGTVDTSFTSEEVGTWDCTLDNSTSTGRLRVTGVNSVTIDWGAIVNRLEVSHA